MQEICIWRLSLYDSSFCLLQNDLCNKDAKSCTFKKIPYDPKTEMTISEIYPAISGEGLSTGKVCVIVRTSGCNLRCSFCDTKYAYEGGTKLTVEEVIKEVKQFNIPTVLFTGGEPLLDGGALAFLRACVHHDIRAVIETNGSISLRPFLLLGSIVMDVKCPSSGMHESLCKDNFNVLGMSDSVKFVVKDREDYLYAVKVTQENSLCNKVAAVFVSPVWSEMPYLGQQLCQWLIEDKSPIRLMIQQHKVIWGPSTRGV